jgi:hypothetical protein
MSCVDCDSNLSGSSLPPCGCVGCADCIEPEVVVVRRSRLPDFCNVIVDTIKGAFSGGGSSKPECKVKIANVVVSGTSATVVLSPSSLTGIEYSKDNVLWQDSPTFNNLDCGTFKVYARQNNFNACIAAKYVQINTDCECVPVWTLVSPLQTQCVNGFLQIREKDGCGNFRWENSTTACGGCTPNLKDVVPQQTQCVSNKKQYLQTDGCGATSWRLTQEPCTNCIVPAVPASATTTPATCNSQGQILSNGSFTYGPISGGNKYGISLGGTYNGPNYDGADVIPLNGVIVEDGLQGYPYTHAYVIRVFNGSNDCYIDRNINFLSTLCQPASNLPSYTVSKVDPTCNGSATLSNGVLQLSNFQNSTRFQLCEDGTFSCIPNYNGATNIIGSNAQIIANNIGFTSNQQYRDFTLRVFNGSLNVYSDAFFRFSNPCYSGGNPGCTQPTNNAAVPTSATCSGSTPNNNASISIGGINNANKYGYSLGNTYSGPDYSSALSIVSGSISITGLSGSTNSTTYVVRLFNQSGTCYKDITVTIAGSNCVSPCVNPTYNNVVPTAATCNGSTPNNDASIQINLTGNVNKYGISNGNSYTGPVYASATGTGTGTLSISGLSGSTSSQQKTLRLFNGSNTCFTDVAVTIPASSCTPSCVSPSYTSKSATPPSCSGGDQNDDAIISIIGVTNVTKYGRSVGSTYSGPNYAGAINTSAGNLTITGVAGSATDQNHTIRLFNGSDSCYTDVVQLVPGNACSTVCNNPAFDMSSTPPTVCDGENTNNDGTVTISNVTDATKYQVCINYTEPEDSFICIPNYVNATDISGSGPIEIIDYLAFTNEQDVIRVWVRVYNGSETCYTDDYIDVQNPCKSCCSMSIGDVSLVNQ